MVWRLYPDHLSAAHAPVDRVVLPRDGTQLRVHVCAADRDRAAGDRRLPIREPLGERARRQLCSHRFYLPRLTRHAGLSVWPVANDLRGSSYFERSTLFLRLDALRAVLRAGEGHRDRSDRCRRSPCYLAVWFWALRLPG